MYIGRLGPAGRFFLRNSKKAFLFSVEGWLISLFFLLAACSEVADNTETGNALAGEDYTVNSDKEALSKRFEVKNEAIHVYEDDGFSLVKKKKETPFTLTLLGELSPPTVDGTVVQGTDITLNGNEAYLSYNVAGETKKGAVDLLDLSDEENPEVLSSLSFPSRDINAISYRSGALYMTGSWDDESLLSFFSKVTVDDESFSDVISDVALSGYAGNDIHVTSNKIYVTTGNNASLFAYDRNDLTEAWTLDIANARAISEYKSKEGPWVLTGEPAQLLDVSQDGELENTYEIGGATIAESKSTVETVKKWSLVTKGEEGFSVICSKDGEVLAEHSPPEITREHDETPVVNAATVSGDYVYTANGEEGVHVYEMGSKTKKTSCNSFELNYLGYLDFGAGLSANHIVASDEYIFVAHGLKGFSVILAQYPD